MIIHKDITDTIGQLAFCLTMLQSLKGQIGNPNNINPQTHFQNITTSKDSINFHFHQYLGSRKTYNHDIIEIEESLNKLEKDFSDILELIGEPTIEQITQLEGIITKIQKEIVGKIKHNPAYYLHLRENFPDNFP